MQETPLDATRKYAKGIIWPVDKETLIETFRRNGAPDDVLQAVSRYHKSRFVAPSDILYALWWSVHKPEHDMARPAY